ncbi:winged helix DNA-binding domain-containing protein [Rhodospirillum centenum]|nr:winged helix DNA-binding domain-containing protein [Rhodospirillum centenum]
MSDPDISDDAPPAPAPVLPTGVPLAVGLPQALAFRLARQHLVLPADDPVSVARTLLGAQAQVQSAAVLQLRARTAGFPDAVLDRALYTDRTLVRLWAQRSTLHLTARDDLGLILALRRLYAGGYHRWYAREGLEPDQVDRLVTAVAEAVAAGPHSRMDLSRLLTPRLGAWAQPWLEHSWGGIIKLAAALGHVCHGPARTEGEAGVEALFVSLPRWVDLPPVPEGRVAMAALLRRYLAVYGPAGVGDFRKFTGLPGAAVPQAFADLGPELLPVDLAGRRAFVLAADEAALRTAEPEPGHLTALPLFDPWLLAHADTGQYLDDRHRKAVYRTAGWISAVVLRQGRVVATWTHRRTAAGWCVTVQPLETLARRELAPLRRRLALLAGLRPGQIEVVVDKTR